MCEKRPNELWLAYMCRYVVEQPRAVLAVIGIAAAIVLYCDLRSFISEQAEAQEKTIRVLSEMFVRLQTIEHRMEVLHMQPPPVTKKKKSENLQNKSFSSCRLRRFLSEFSESSNYSVGS